MGKEKQSKSSVSYPVKSRINAYGFIFLKKKLLANLGWTKDMALTIEKNEDGSITVRPA